MPPTSNDPLKKYKNNKPEKNISLGRLSRSDANAHKAPWMGYQPQGNLKFNPKAKLNPSQIQDRRNEPKISNEEARQWTQKKWKEIGANHNGWGTSADIGPNERALGKKWNSPSPQTTQTNVLKNKAQAAKTGAYKVR